jgi:hypothetical protein
MFALDQGGYRRYCACRDQKQIEGYRRRENCEKSLINGPTALSARV